MFLYCPLSSCKYVINIHLILLKNIEIESKNKWIYPERKFPCKNEIPKKLFASRWNMIKMNTDLILIKHLPRVLSQIRSKCNSFMKKYYSFEQKNIISLQKMHEKVYPRYQTLVWWIIRKIIFIFSRCKSTYISLKSDYFLIIRVSKIIKHLIRKQKLGQKIPIKFSNDNFTVINNPSWWSCCCFIKNMHSKRS